MAKALHVHDGTPLPHPRPFKIESNSEVVVMNSENYPQQPSPKMIKTWERETLILYLAVALMSFAAILLNELQKHP